MVEESICIDCIDANNMVEYIRTKTCNNHEKVLKQQADREVNIKNKGIEMY